MVYLASHPPERKVQQALFVFLPVYPELVGVVGSTVPDYRGLFLRGQGSQSSYHYGTVTHSSAGLGQLQGDAIREIWGDILTGAVEEDAAFSGAFRSAEIGRGGMKEGETMVSISELHG